MNAKDKVSLALSSLYVDQPVLGLALSYLELRVSTRPDCTFAAAETFVEFGPAWVDASSTREVVFALGNAALSFVCNQHQRCGERNRRAWVMACCYVNSQFLIDHRIGALPAGALYDPAYAGKSPEEVYEILARLLPGKPDEQKEVGVVIPGRLVVDASLDGPTLDMPPQYGKFLTDPIFKDHDGHDAVIRELFQKYTPT